MTTRTVFAGTAFEAPRVPQSASRPVSAGPCAPGWLERLAAWSDRHPPAHHRLGSWTCLGVGSDAGHRAIGLTGLPLRGN